MNKSIFLILIISVFIGCTSTGKWMESEGFKYQGIRTMGHSQYQGASVTEALYVLSSIEKDNGEQWYSKWYKMAEYQLNISKLYSAEIAKGNALLRASNYFRVSEFFISTNDPRRLEAYTRSRESFVKALSHLQIKHEIWDIPYETGSLRAYYFPGDFNKPLLLFANGLDGTVEENYFFNGSAAITRGYPVILYEGPGQSMALRRDNIVMTYNWDKPVGSVLSWAEKKYPELEDSEKVLYGISIGGNLSGQAASKMEEIDGLIIHGGPMDMQKTVLAGLPNIAANLYLEGDKKSLNSMVNILDKLNILSYQDRWVYSQMKWVYGEDNMSDILDHLEPYTLIDKKIDIPVLVMKGDDDMYEGINNNSNVSFSNKQIYNFPTESGASSHCQAGAIEQSSLIVFKWLEENF